MIEIARRKWAEMRCRRALSRTPAWQPLQSYLSRTNSTGCSYIDYWHLYAAVKQYRPKTILELGTGASTVVLGHAVTDWGGHVVSMEESPEWYKHALDNLPRGLPVDIVLSETVEDSFSIFRGIRYRDIPPGSYDFVFVDGPGYKTKTGEVTFDFDLIALVAKTARPLRGIIDKRISTCFVMQRVLPGKVRYVKHLGLAFVDAVTQADLRSIDPTTPSASFKLGATVDFGRMR